MAENLQRGAAKGGIRTVSETITGQDTDGSGDITHTFSDLKEILSKADVTAQAEEGHTVNVQSISDDQVTLRVYSSAGSAAAHAAETGTVSIAINLTARGY